MNAKPILIIITLSVAILAVAILIGISIFGHPAAGPAPVACTMEAKICPDGSSVGRVPPSCEFAACPNPGSSTSTATSTTPTSTPGSGGIIGGGNKSGVKGRVMLGPTCPVERTPPDPQCADKPYATLVAVFRSGDPVHAAALGQSDANGNFSFSLPPGNYVLGAGTSNLPRCSQVSITVKANTYASTTISCDTGIR